MTYCAVVKVKGGIVMASDSRSNAGMDNIASFSKMRMWTNSKDRWIGVVWSGHLGVTQSVAYKIDQAMTRDLHSHIMNASSMRQVVECISDHLKEATHEHGFLRNQGIDIAANFIVCGQVAGEESKVFLIYSQGNFIELGNQSYFFQIGETKYGKPILDRVIDEKTRISDVIKCMLVSFDSTMRSNLSVGLPIELAVYKEDTFGPADYWSVNESDPYFAEIRSAWAEGLKDVFRNLPEMRH